MIIYEDQKTRSIILILCTSLIIAITTLFFIYDTYDIHNVLHIIIKIIILFFLCLICYFLILLFWGYSKKKKIVVFVICSVLMSLLYFTVPEKPEYADIDSIPPKTVTLIPWNFDPVSSLKYTTIILPMEYISKNPNSRVAILELEEIILQIGGNRYKFTPIKYVDLTLRGMKINSDFKRKSILAGQTVNHETLFQNFDLEWRDFSLIIEKYYDENIIMNIKSKIDNSEELVKCEINRELLNEVDINPSSGFTIKC